MGGIPIVGAAPQTSTLPAKATHASMNLHGAKLDVRSADEKVLNSLSKSTVLLPRQKFWARHAGNFGKGVYRNPLL